MLNVANTVSPHSVINAVARIKKERENGELEDKTINITGELAKAFLEFTSMIPENKKLKKGKSLRFKDNDDSYEKVKCPEILINFLVSFMFRFNEEY